METEKPSIEKQDAIDKLVTFIGDEIKFAQEQSQQPGWTRWAISGSLAAASWLLLQELQSGHAPLLAVLALLLAISLTLGVGSIFQQLLSPLPFEGSHGRFVFTNLLAFARVRVLLQILRYFALGYLSFFLSLQVSRGATWFSYIENVLRAADWIAVLVLSYLAIPIPLKVTLPKSASRVNQLLHLVLAAYPAIIYVAFVFRQADLIAVIRVAGLIAAIYYLIQLLLDVSSTSPLIDSLVRIRRGLILGHTDYPTAVEQVDIAVAGMKLSNVLQDAVGQVLELLDELNAKLQKMASLISEIEKLSDAHNGDFTDADADASQAQLMKSVLDLMLECLKLSKDKIPAASRPLERRIMLISRLSDVTAAEIREVMRMIDKAAETTDAEMEHVRAIATALQAKWGEELAAARTLREIVS